ncbi:hypothetical protein [Rhizobium leguminosarum]|uniref:hypothetical protein n=1 Tax=Rhizobium leguminosarum TaxID=384 RepID=UPI000486D9D5|nr:hypothetical protein [Rhizobium leguminosarum]WFT86835.1 hypothetical protein QA638_04245 [Rhizobium leguminosarum]
MGVRLFSRLIHQIAQRAARAATMSVQLMLKGELECADGLHLSDDQEFIGVGTVAWVSKLLGKLGSHPSGGNSATKRYHCGMADR